jgi:ATP-dependent DNA helicase DinG
MSRAAADPAAPVLMPEAGALAAGPRGAVWLSADGEVAELSLAGARKRAAAEPPLVCHAVARARRLGVAPFPAFDVLELFAFVRPAAFCLPTVRGLADALGLARPDDLTGEALCLMTAARGLLTELAESGGGKDAAPIASVMGRAGWPWAPAVLAALGSTGEGSGAAALAVWNGVKQWREQAPEPAPGHAPVAAREARHRLAELLDADAESRPEQADYAAGTAAAFAPRDQAGAPHLVLAEAGTGIGKTLGYIAPASLWAEKNGGAVWLSTFTKNLQRQIDQELDRLYPNPRDKAEKAVVRKGRENYLCLLNLEEAAGRAGTDPRAAVALGLIGRWALRTRDGDMVGGDFPSWLADLLGYRAGRGLTDRRGECIYSACSHFQKCFIERAVRKARRAEVVIANHALVMVQAALGSEDRAPPTRYVFDEGHHLFDAADGAFSANLSGIEMAELRRWVLGAESRRRGRARGLKRRAEDLIAGDDKLTATLERALAAARALPGEGWLGRLGEGAPRGPGEGFLALVREQVLARSSDAEGPYSLEAPAAEPVPGLVAAGVRLEAALASLAEPLLALVKGLAARLDDEADELDSATRQRIEAVCRGLVRRGDITLGAWRRMLVDLEGETPAEFVDWLSVERFGGRETNVGMHRHWLDPTIPFAEAVLASAHGAVITSATLRDRSDATPEDWSTAEVRTGALHMPLPATRLSLASPFDYPSQTRVLIVTDVRRTDPEQVAAAYRELFLAAGGGALGLFTAIARLRQVHERIAAPLDEAGLPLYAQHVDAIDTPTLVDIFRAETDSCLLGTDAVRDGVDVPGRALRLIVFDRVPWPRPDILHRARRQVFGGNAYDDMLARLRLKQAYGRLIRRADDRGVFVLLDAMTPSRLLNALPEGVAAQRLGLADAVAEAARFLSAGSA